MRAISLEAARRLSLVLMGVTLAPAARAQPGPSSKLPPERDVYRPEIESDLQRCSRDAVARGVFGDVTVDLYGGGGPNVSGTPGLGRHRPVLEDCVRAAMIKLLELEKTHPQAGRVGWPRDVEIHLGRPGPILPRAAILLPAWTAHVSAVPAETERTRAALQRLLPPDVRVRADRCLVVSRGAFVWEGLQLSLRLLGRRVAPFWDRVFDPELLSGQVGPPTYLLPGPALLTIGRRGTDGGLCLQNLDPETSHVLRGRMSALGACWQGDLEATLLAPMVAFPVHESFAKVSTNGQTTCALDASGRLTCCGRSWRRPPPDDRWRSINVALGCGVTSQGRLSCWGTEAPTPDTPPLLDLAKGSGPVCAVTVRRDVLCFARSSSPTARSPRELRSALPFPGGARSVCTSTAAGRICHEAERIPTPHLEGQVSRVSVWNTRGCALLRDGGVACWSTKAPPTRHPGPFVDLLVGPDASCALGEDGRASCWSNESGATVTFAGASDFSSLSSFPRAEVICGLDRAGQVRCAGSGEQGPSTTTTPPPPPGPFQDLAEAGGQFCGVSRTGAVQCWGRRWPDAGVRP
jgi:hypothetical protein